MAVVQVPFLRSNCLMAYPALAALLGSGAKLTTLFCFVLFCFLTLWSRNYESSLKAQEQWGFDHFDILFPLDLNSWFYSFSSYSTIPLGKTGKNTFKGEFSLSKHLMTPLHSFSLLCLSYVFSVPGRPFSFLWFGELLLILQDPAQQVLPKPFLTLTGKVFSFLCSSLRSYANICNDTCVSPRVIYLCVYLLHSHVSSWSTGAVTTYYYPLSLAPGLATAITKKCWVNEWMTWNQVLEGFGDPAEWFNVSHPQWATVRYSKWSIGVQGENISTPIYIYASKKLVKVSFPNILYELAVAHVFNS